MLGFGSLDFLIKLTWGNSYGIMPHKGTFLWIGVVGSKFGEIGVNGVLFRFGASMV